MNQKFFLFLVALLNFRVKTLETVQSFKFCLIFNFTMLIAALYYFIFGWFFFDIFFNLRRLFKQGKFN